MRIIRAQDYIIRFAAEYQPWFPEPDRNTVYRDDAAWQNAHLWDHWGESDNFHGPFAGPTILHHPDLQHALDNGWRVVGGDKSIDHQSRGETGSGTSYLYKIGDDGLIHKAHLNVGPEDTHLYDEGHAGDRLDQEYGTVPEKNWRHLIMSEGGLSESPDSHATLKDLVNDEIVRSKDPEHNGYKDYRLLDRSARNEGNATQERKYHNTYRRAWDTGTNEPHLHWNDPVPDPYANIDQIPRGGKPHPRYGSDS